MSLGKKRPLRWDYLEILVMLVDQATKFCILSWLPSGNKIMLGSFLNLTQAHNHGAAFGILASAGGWQRWLFIVAAIAIYIVGFVWMKRLDPVRDRFTGMGIALMLGGAIGNVIDRIRFGYVIDFIDFHVGAWHWYTFNVADIAICVGAAFVILSSIKKS